MVHDKKIKETMFQYLVLANALEELGVNTANLLGTERCEKLVPILMKHVPRKDDVEIADDFIEEVKERFLKITDILLSE